ncbi:MAG: hypothetical protein WD651_15235 [Acidimicrobiia bacterium]
MRRWFTFIAGLTVVVVGGVALGLPGSDLWADKDELVEFPVEVGEPSTTKVVEEADEPKYEEGPKYDEDAGYEHEEEAKEEDEVTEVTEPDDTTPPDFQILHPVNGQAFETKGVVFEGNTEPGARVFAGQYEADVDGDGGWRIVLILAPGSNHATLKAKDAAGNITEASVVVTYVVPKKEEPKEEEKEEPQEWEFSANQVYGECSENPPYDVFHGTGKPGSRILVLSEYGDDETEVNEHGEWEIKVFFPESPIGHGILVKVKDEFGHQKAFEFTHTD